MTDNKNLWIQKAVVNKTEGVLISAGDTPVETEYNDKEKLFEACQREFGKCTGKLWAYSKGRGVIVGWTFEKKQKDSATRKSYTQETWVTIYKDKLGMENKPELEHA
jgi:hypothetical protein